MPKRMMKTNNINGKNVQIDEVELQDKVNCRQNQDQMQRFTKSITRDFDTWPGPQQPVILAGETRRALAKNGTSRANQIRRNQKMRLHSKARGTTNCPGVRWDVEGTP